MRIFDTVYFVLWEMLPYYHFVLRCFSTVVPGLWHFARIIVKGPWAKVACRCHGLLLTAGVGNAQPGEEKTSCQIFSVDSFASSDLWLTLILYCGAKKKEKEEKNQFRSSQTLFGFPHSSRLLRHQDFYRFITFESKAITTIEPLRIL